MAHYTGLVTVDISSFSAFRTAVLGNGYNVDGLYGEQCIDMAKLLAGNAGRPSPYWKSQPDGEAYQGWTNLASRIYNADTYFYLVYNRGDVREGDLVVLNSTDSLPNGHIAFANTDWNENTNVAYLLGQNQVNPSPSIGSPNTLTKIDVASFLGAFRFKEWGEEPPSPVIITKSHFPWVLYARKLRNRYRM